MCSVSYLMVPFVTWRLYNTQTAKTVTIIAKDWVKTHGGPHKFKEPLGYTLFPSQNFISASENVAWDPVVSKVKSTGLPELWPCPMWGSMRWAWGERYPKGIQHYRKVWTWIQESHSSLWLATSTDFNLKDQPMILKELTKMTGGDRYKSQKMDLPKFSTQQKCPSIWTK